MLIFSTRNLHRMWLLLFVDMLGQDTYSWYILCKCFYFLSFRIYNTPEWSSSNISYIPMHIHFSLSLPVKPPVYLLSKSLSLLVHDFGPKACHKLHHPILPILPVNKTSAAGILPAVSFAVTYRAILPATEYQGTQT